MDKAVAGESGNLQNADLGRIELPLVSVVVINYNYGKYLRHAVESVFDQTYPAIECIIVDNASTDDSNRVLEEVEARYPSVTVLRRPDNGGQSVATIQGFAATSGQYVVFLDADDMLLPSFVETHVYVHLSLRVPVGLTSADMIQVVESSTVLGTYFSLSEYVRSERGKRANLFRPIEVGAPEAWPLRSPQASIEEHLHLVEPYDVRHWCWAPTSGNCFRRDALQLFLNNESLAKLRSCTDSYLIRGISGVTGSVLIDRALAIYRLHGLNVFSKHPHLNGIVSFEQGGVSDTHTQLGRQLIIDHLVDNAALFLRKLPSTWHYEQILKALDEAWPHMPSPTPGFDSYLSAKLASRLSELSRNSGHTSILTVLLRREPPRREPVVATKGLDTLFRLIRPFKRLTNTFLVSTFLWVASTRKAS